jgi:hypothetical protein
MMNALDFFTAPGLMTSPESWGDLLDRLPNDLQSLCKVLQGLLIHVSWAEQYGVQLTGPRRDEVQLRSIARELERIIELDPRPCPPGSGKDRGASGDPCPGFALGEGG